VRQQDAYTTNAGATPPFKANISSLASIYSIHGIQQPGFQTELRPPMTLTFDLLTPEVDRSCSCPGEDLCQFALKLVHSFSFTSW